MYKARRGLQPHHHAFSGVGAVLRTFLAKIGGRWHVLASLRIVRGWTDSFLLELSRDLAHRRRNEEERSCELLRVNRSEKL